jgi:hypothetical protein
VFQWLEENLECFASKAQNKSLASSLLRCYDDDDGEFFSSPRLARRPIYTPYTKDPFRIIHIHAIHHCSLMGGGSMLHLAEADSFLYSK